MNKLSLLYCIILIAFSQATQYVPIQSQYDGITIGKPNAYFWLEAYYDPMCPSSAQQNFILNEVFEQIGFFKQNQLKFTLHLMPLPYHFNSFFFSQVAHYLQNQYGPNITLKYLDFVFAFQNQFSNSVTQNMTTNQIYQMISEFVADVLNPYSIVLPDEIYNALQNSTFNQLTRNSWKYGCERNVAGTPTFFANGVMISNASDFEVQDWINFLSQYINVNNQPSDITKDAFGTCSNQCYSEFGIACQQSNECATQEDQFARCYNVNQNCQTWDQQYLQLDGDQIIPQALLNTGETCISQCENTCNVTDDDLQVYLGCISLCFEFAQTGKNKK